MVREGYKQTELGEIPEDWGLVCLSRVADVRDGTHDSPKYMDRGVPFITSKNIIEGHLDLDNISYISERDAFEINKRSKVDQGDILMSMIGTIGDVVLIEDAPGFCIKNVALIKSKSIEAEFLVQLIESGFYQRHIIDNLDGGIQKFISLGALRDLSVLVPSSIEQQAIAKALSDVDGLIDGLQKLIAKKRDIKSATMQQLLTGKTRLPGFGEGKGYKQTELGEIPDDWNICRVNELGEVKRGAGSQSITYVQTGGVRFIRINDFFEDNPVYVRDTDEVKRFSLQEKDILFAGTGNTAGASFIPRREWVGLPHSYNAPRIRVNEKCAKQYLLFSLQSENVLNQQLACFVGAAQPFLDITAISNFKIMTPPFGEQNAIASVLTDMAKDIESLQTRLEKNKAIKQGMMQELLTGKTRLI